MNPSPLPSLEQLTTDPNFGVFAYGRGGMIQYHHDNATGSVYVVGAFAQVQHLDYGAKWNRTCETWAAFNKRLRSRLQRDGWAVDR